MNSSARIRPDLWVSRTTSPAIAGLVLRSGPALAVRTSSGREIVISTDDPVGAASAFAAT